MFKQLADWLDDRTGFRDLMKEALDEPIPGGARWRYVFGSRNKNLNSLTC